MNTQLKVGDVLYSSWGYEQTNVDFYKVISLSPSGKSAKIVRIGQKIVDDGTAGFMTEYVVADPNSEHPHDKKVLTKRIQMYGGKPYLKLNSYSGATLWDGQKKYQSHYA